MFAMFLSGNKMNLAQETKMYTNILSTIKY